MPTKVTARKRKLSREGLLLIKSLEGFRPRAVARPDDVLVIGYGHTRSAREGIVISEHEAELLLLHDLIPVVGYINTHIHCTLNQHQFDALASFLFNLELDSFRTSEVAKLLEEGRLEEVPAALSATPDTRPVMSDMSFRRRSAERALFETPESQLAPIAALLTAPIQKPGDEMVFPELEVFLGQTGVVRHDESLFGPHLPADRKRKPKVDWQSLASAVLLGAVGLMIGLACVTAFKQGLDDTIARTHGLLIGSGLCAMGVALIGVAIWACTAGKRTVKTAS